MRRFILGLTVMAISMGCGSGTDNTQQGGLTVNLGSLPAVVAANADSAFVRVRKTGVAVNEVRRIGLTGTNSVTVTVPAASDYDVSVVTIVSGSVNLAIGGGMVDGVTVEPGGIGSTTVPIVAWSAEVLELPDTVISGAVITGRFVLSDPVVRDLTDGELVGVNLFFTPPPATDDYFVGIAEDRFFSPSPGDTLRFSMTAPVSGTDTELWFHLRWNSSTSDANWTVGFAFQVALPTLTLGDTLWWRPLDVP